MKLRILTMVTFVGLLTSAGWAAATAPATPAANEGVSLTVYNNNFAVVRDVRKIRIDNGQDVKFTDVAQQIDPTSVHFASLTDPAATLLEQNYQYDLVSADKLLRKYVDRNIEVICEGGTYTGTLLSFDHKQLVLATSEGLVMVQRGENLRDIRFGALPEGLLTRPTLLWKVATGTPGDHTAEVTYQTGGLSWHAEYVMMLNDDETLADLSGWVSVDNRSGKTYRDATLKFIAGDVQRYQPPQAPRMYKMGAMRAELADSAAGMVEKAFFEYHMYTLGRPSTVADNETKQLEMFDPAKGVGVTKRYLYNPLGEFRWVPYGRHTDRHYGARQASKKVNIFIEFRNSEANKLGLPLPAGKIRLYKRNTDDGAQEFIGEEKIDHTPKDEQLSLRVGNAFDIVGERKQTHYAERSNLLRETIEIKLRNHKETDVIVRVKEPMYRWRNWRILDETASHKNLDSRTVAWDLPVKAEGETVLTYTVEYTNY